MSDNVLFYGKGKSTISLENNKSIGICLFCDVLKISWKNYKSGECLTGRNLMLLKIMYNIAHTILTKNSMNNINVG